MILPPSLDAFLFDIDGTLMNTEGRGSNTFLDAAEQVFDVPAHDMQLTFAGATDLGLLNQIARQFKLPAMKPENTNAFFSLYADMLKEALPPGSCESLPGAGELLQRLQKADFSIGLVTGNAEKTAKIKVEACGLAEFFQFGGYGDQHPDRAELVKIAINACKNRKKSRNWSLIGDTPNDILAAKRNEIISIGVCTGSFTLEKLEKEKPDHIICYLSDIV